MEILTSKSGEEVPIYKYGLELLIHEIRFSELRSCTADSGEFIISAKAELCIETKRQGFARGITSLTTSHIVIGKPITFDKDPLLTLFIDEITTAILATFYSYAQKAFNKTLSVLLPNYPKAPGNPRGLSED